MILNFIKLVLVSYGLYGFYDIYLEYHGWQNGLGFDFEFLLIRGLFSLLAVVSAIGLHLNKSWSQYLLYLVFGVFTIGGVIALTTNIGQSVYLSKSQLIKSFSFSLVLIFFSIFAIYFAYVHFRKQTANKSLKSDAASGAA